MQALKIVVIVLGVLIVVTTGVILAVIAGRLSRGPAAPSPLASGQVDIPAGARVEAMAAVADRVILDLLLPGGERQLVVIDLASGRKLGTIGLRPAP